MGKNYLGIKKRIRFPHRALATKNLQWGTLILLAYFVAAIFSSYLAPFRLDMSFETYLPPGQPHLLGTNDVGKDIFSELLYASRVSLLVGFLAGSLSTVSGTLIGMAAGFYRSRFAEAAGGLIDIFLLIPRLPLLIVLSAYLGASLWNIIFVIGFLTWGATARVVWARVAQIREMHYIEGALAIGCSNQRVIFVHILPNVLEIVKSKFVLSVAGAMLAEASLSFLGLGDPRYLSWGMMLLYAFRRGGFANGLWNWYLPPGICIALCVFAFFLLGSQNRERKTGHVLQNEL